MPTREAQLEAKRELHKLNLVTIGEKRVAQCSSLELFYVMFIRAMMTNKNHILIDMPYSIINNLEDIDLLIENIELLNFQNKYIFILDTLNHNSRYNSRVLKT
ncbi:MAG: hypothetical protein U9P38_02040 [Campylobacterota bacterium]|nr:hypothetical protein [Campylobacterota bacterium]